MRQPKLFYVSSSTTTTTISTQTVSISRVTFTSKSSRWTSSIYMILCFQVCYHVLSTATTNVPDPTLCSKRSPSENKKNRNFEKFISFWLTIIIALWVYPNVNGSVRNFSQNTPTAPIFSYSIISEKIFVLQFGHSFTFFTYL